MKIEVEQAVLDHIAMFIDFLLQNVEIIEINVPKENVAHRVFVTINDRGLRLSPIDLLKGRLLASIPDKELNHQAHEQWAKMLLELKTIDADEDSAFFKTYFRSRWAETIRGKSRGDVPKDFDIIAESYHRWFEDNSTRIGVTTSDEHADFILEELKHYSQVYSFIRKCEENLIPGYEHIFYNAARNYSMQPMVLMSAVLKNDGESVWKSKIRLTSRYLDFLLTIRTIEGKDNKYDSLRDASFDLTKEFRGLDKVALLVKVQQKWDSLTTTVSNLANINYTDNNRADVLFLLSRIASYLEDAIGIQNRTGFVEFWKRDRQNKTFDIEHLFKVAYDTQNIPPDDQFTGEADYKALRNNIGALVLLGRSRNRSLQDKNYSEKLGVYATENVLAQTLTTGFYQNNPALDRFLQANPAIGLTVIPAFGKTSINRRQQTYARIAEKVWERPTVV